MDCSACATTLPDNARFCPSCGTPVAGPGLGSAVGEKRKVVTALFCDLVGSTALSGVLEPETLRAVVLRYFALMQERIEAHGGAVEKFIGDAVMAVFGVPAVHEDDARRAANAALDMIAALHTLNTDLDKTFGCRLAVRIGVNTGEVVTSADGAARQAMVSGEVVNVAARLEQRADTDQILIGPDTLAALGAAAIVEPVGPLSLKGKTDAVTAHRLLGIRPDHPELTRRFDVPFIGRERELAGLDSATGRLITVLGEAGVGKTRLVREWLRRRSRILLGSARCHQYRDQASLTPLAGALRQVLDAAAPPSDERGQAMLATLRASLLADGAPGASLAGTCAAVAGLLDHLAAGTPVVLVVDDLHWADPMLLDALGRVSAELRTGRVQVICAARPDLPGRPLGAVLTVPPLTPDESALLAAELVAAQEHRVAVPEGLVARAEGNPLHLEQLLAVFGDGTDIDALPGTVTSVLAARIDALRPAERVVLDAAAVIGRHFSPAEVSLLVNAAQASCVVSLDALTSRRLIEPEPDQRESAQRYRFSSGLVRDVTYQGISKQQRWGWHERLAGLAGHDPQATARTAHHLDQAYRYRIGLGLHDAHTESLRERAGRTLTDAAGFALSRADLPWSEDLHRGAFEHSSRHDPWWPALGQGLGETLIAAGKADEGAALLHEVIDVARARGDDLAAAHARLQLAALAPEPGQDSAAQAARTALPVFLAAGDQLGLARAKVRLAQEQQLLGQHAAATGLLGEALRHALRADAEPEQAMALGALGISLWLGPTPATEAVRECRALLAEHGGRGAAVQLTLNCPLAMLLALQQRFDEARRLLAGIAPLAEDLGYAEAAVFLPLFRAAVESLARRLGPAEELLRSAMAATDAIGAAGLGATVARDLARVLIAQGKDREDARVRFDDEPAHQLPPAEAADELGIRALLRSARGEHGSAVELAEAAVAESAKTDSSLTRAAAALDLAEVCLAAGRYERAGDAAADAENWFRRKENLAGAHQAARLAARIGVSGREE